MNRLLLLLCFGLGMHVALSAQNKTVTLSGRIEDATNGIPIENALVELLLSDGSSIAKNALSDEQGWYKIEEVEPGNYKLHFEAKGYESFDQTLTIYAGEPASISIRLKSKALQLSTQTVRGQVVDAASGKSITGALIELMNFSPYKAGYTDFEGHFRLEGVPVGRQKLRIYKTGYEEYIVREAIISAGKELILEIPLEEQVRETPGRKADPGNPGNLASRMRIVNTRMLPSNQMILNGVFPFTIEDVQRYAGCLNDPARTIGAALPGTFNTNDSQNFIISRGNSPYGNAWLIEGVPFENPNLFGTMGNTGGPFQVLNTNALHNSDFIMGAAPAGYGAATSSIFDFHIRDGNDQRFEFTGQFSLLGGELVLEGPFKKGRASFLAAYRYSLLHVIQLLGISVTSGAAPQYQDLTFKLNFETKKNGTFSVFGVGGLGYVPLLDKDIDPNDLFAERGRDLYVYSRMAMLGLKHRIFLSRNTTLQTTLFGVHQNYRSHRDSLDPSGTAHDLYAVQNVRTNAGINISLQSKINSAYSFRTGLRFNAHILDIHDRYLDRDYTEYWSKDILFENQVFLENLLRFSDRFTLSLGVHGYYFTLNKSSWAVEPRLAANWYLGRRHTLSLGYGWHSKYPSFTMLFFVQNRPDGTWDTDNRNLGLQRSHHLNLSYNVQLAHEWRVLTEVYGQYHTGIPVETTPGSFSLLNYGEHPIYPKLSGLQSTGLGYNYGAELTVQKFFGQGYYATVAGTYFRSFYQGSDAIWRPTAFDARYSLQVLAGKEFKIGRRKNNALTMDIRFHHHGGRPYTPIDLDASIAAGEEVLDLSRAYSLRVKPYSRIDFKFGARFNHRKKRISHYFYVDLINVGMFDNELKKQFSPISNQIATVYQFGLVPNIFYRLNF